VIASLFVVLVGVWFISNNQPLLPPKQNQKVDTPLSPSAQVVKAKQEADSFQKAKAPKLKAVKAVKAKKTLNIGDEYGGGKIAWLDAAGQHGLIAAKADIPGNFFTWKDAKAKCGDLGDDWHLPTIPSIIGSTSTKKQELLMF